MSSTDTLAANFNMIGKETRLPSGLAFLPDPRAAYDAQPKATRGNARQRPDLQACRLGWTPERQNVKLLPNLVWPCPCHDNLQIRVLPHLYHLSPFSSPSFFLL